MNFTLFKTNKLINHIVYNIQRYKSSEKKIPSGYIRNLNYETKTLFGAVKKNKIETENKEKLENDNSSEIYWMTQYVKPIETRKTKFPKISNKTNKLTKTASKVSTKILPIQKRENKILNTEKISIPFTSNQLNEILEFPLIHRDNKTLVETLNTDEVKVLPSVTRILQATMSETSRNSLKQWKARKIEELGENGFLELQQANLQQGKEFHEILDNYFKTGSIPGSTSSNIKTWESVGIVLKRISPAVELVEAHLVHPELKYKGIVDCVTNIDSNLHVIEWKKSDRPKTTINATYDAPIQLCAYLGALNADPRYSKLKIANGVVVVAYTNGQWADYYKLNQNDLNKYWRVWLSRVQEYWIRLRDGTLPEPI